ncbi:hypothetical protein AAE478_004286 [Parahypoxylon ruwenzoriense]
MDGMDTLVVAIPPRDLADNHAAVGPRELRVTDTSTSLERVPVENSRAVLYYWHGCSISCVPHPHSAPRSDAIFVEQPSVAKVIFVLLLTTLYKALVEAIYGLVRVRLLILKVEYPNIPQ